MSLFCSNPPGASHVTHRKPIALTLVYKVLYVIDASSLSDSICTHLPFLLTYSALATLASMLFLIQTCSSQSSLLKLFCPLLFAWLASSLQASSQMISCERRLPDHPIAYSSPTVLPIVSIPLFCSMSPQSTYVFGMLHLLLWMAPYWSVSSARKQTHCLFYIFLCPQLSA